MSTNLASLVFILFIHPHVNGQSQPQHRPSYNQEALIPTYYNQPSGSSPAQSNPSQTYLTYHPHHHPNPSFYHQNVYLAPPNSATGQAAHTSSYSYFGAPSANLYTFGPAGTASAAGLMVASSSSQPVMTAVPPPQMQMQMQSSEKAMDSPDSGVRQGEAGSEKSQGKNQAQLGIVFGRPISGYDGNYYVPVFYPLSWMGGIPSDPLAAYSSNAAPSSIPSPYHQPQSYQQQMTQMTQAQFYPQPQYLSAPQPAPASSQAPYHRMIVPIYQSQAPIASHYRPYTMINGAQPKQADEMMPSDVTPDLNGNFKRSAVTAASFDDAGSYFFGDPTTFGMPNYGGHQEGQTGGRHRQQQGMSGDSSSSYYYISPVLKYRDPKDDMNLAIEASKEQYNAQKQFEKEVLMSDDHSIPSSRPHDHSGSSSQFDPRQGIAVPASPRSNASVDSSGISTQIESRSSPEAHLTAAPAVVHKSGTTQTSAAAHHSAVPNSNEPPIVTSIEIYDLPGANKYLGLAPQDSSGPIFSSPATSSSNGTGTSAQHNSHQMAPIKLPFSLSALPASKFYRRKFSSESKV